MKCWERREVAIALSGVMWGGITEKETSELVFSARVGYW